MGLTGGIGSGKSTVGRIFEELGAVTLDADSLVREMLAPGGRAVAAVSQALEGVRDPNGGIDRKALADRVFADPDARRRLESILHPLVVKERREKLRAIHEERGQDAIVVSEAALIFEAGTAGEFDATVLVTAPTEVRRARLLAAGWPVGEMDRRAAAQWCDERKRPLADFVVDNGGDPERTRREVESVWERLMERIRAGG
ncbi:MAG: dephospho-CoA kinase [Acidobacteriota bacterium]